MKLDGFGRSKVWLNGKILEGVRSVHLNTGVNQTSEITLVIVGQHVDVDDDVSDSGFSEIGEKIETMIYGDKDK